MSPEGPIKKILPPNTELLVGPSLDSKIIIHEEELEVEVITSIPGWDRIKVTPKEDRKGPSGTFYTPTLLK